MSLLDNLRLEGAVAVAGARLCPPGRRRSAPSCSVCRWGVAAVLADRIVLVTVEVVGDLALRGGSRSRPGQLLLQQPARGSAAGPRPGPVPSTRRSTGRPRPSPTQPSWARRASDSDSSSLVIDASSMIGSYIERSAVPSAHGPGAEQEHIRPEPTAAREAAEPVPAGEYGRVPAAARGRDCDRNAVAQCAGPALPWLPAAAAG